MIIRNVIVSLVALVAAIAPNITAAAPQTVVATSGSHQLTEGMLEDAIYFGQFLGGRRFTTPDAAAMREGLISTFRVQPAKEVAGYQALAQFVPALRNDRSSLVIAKAREATWAAFGKNPGGFSEFQNDPAGKIILKYNPVVVSAGDVIITRAERRILICVERLGGEDRWCRTAVAIGNRRVPASASSPVCFPDERAAGILQASREPAGAFPGDACEPLHRSLGRVRNQEDRALAQRRARSGACAREHCV